MRRLNDADGCYTDRSVAHKVSRHVVAPTPSDDDDNDDDDDSLFCLPPLFACDQNRLASLLNRLHGADAS